MGGLSALDEEIRGCLVWFCAGFRTPGRGTLLTVIEDFTNEVGVGNVYDDAELAIAERAACDVDVEDALGAQERGAVGASELTAGRWIRVLLSVC